MFISLKPMRAIALATPARTYISPSRATPELFDGQLTRTQPLVANHKAHDCIPKRKFSHTYSTKSFSNRRQGASVEHERTYFMLRPICSSGYCVTSAAQPQSPTACSIPNRAFSTTSRLESSSDNDVGDKSQPRHDFKTLMLTRPSKHVASIELNRPKVKNAFSLESAAEFVKLFKMLDDDSTVRCAVLSGQGPDFTSGVDVKSFMTVYAQLQETEDIARRAKLLRGCVEEFQAPFKAMYSFSKPIICVQHGLSIGLAMELAACCDIRYCSSDAKLAIREVLIGIAADVGSLQLMPRLASNQSLLHELVYTGRYMTPDEALKIGFVSRILDTKWAAMVAALELATTISKRSPVAVQGSKRNLQFSRDKPFLVGLDYNAVWNAAMMQGSDVVKAIGGIMSKQNEDEIEYDDF